MDSTQLVRSAGSRDPAERARLPRRVAAVALVLALAASAAFAVRTTRSGEPSAAPPAARLDAGSRRVEPRGIEALRQRLAAVPRDDAAWAALGFAYVQEGRITGDPSFYPKAEEALRRSLALDGRRNAEAFVGLGALAAARHDFAAALEWGKRAEAIDPHSADVYAVIGDALVELGRYPEAFDALQRMVDLRPGLSAYARASYAWELQGNVPNAIRALELALEAAPTPADAAFACYYLGELHWNNGRVAEAAGWYARSGAHDPTYLPAEQGLAKIDAARGAFDRAIRRYESLVERVPLPEYVIELADLYEATGDAAGAKRQFELLRVEEQLLRASGVNIDLEQALFRADHGIDVKAGLAAAEAEWKRRKSVFVADALAWSLYANGRYREALPYAERALRLGTRNALFYFHKGTIERALGQTEPARRDLRTALDINPNFSFRWASHAQAILAALD